jgi:hypothetical protein
MALIGVLRNDLAAVGTHLVAAVRAWREGGALDPTAALIGELRGLQRSLAGSLEDAAHEALRIVERAAAPNAAEKDLGLALEPLQRELGSGVADNGRC